MEIRAIVAAIGRRWYVSVPLLALTMFTLYTVVGTNPAGYKAEASVSIVPVKRTNNPFAMADGANFVPALLSRLGGDAFAQQVRAAGTTGSWTVADPTGTSIIDVTVTDATAADALGGLNTVVKEATQSMKDLQTLNDTPPNALYTLIFVNPPTRGVPQYGSKVKVALALWVVLMAVSCAIVLSVDSLLLRRKRRKQPGGAHGAKFRRIPPLPSDWEESA